MLKTLSHPASAFASLHRVTQATLRDPIQVGRYLRAYCHIHGSDHQRSLSINRETGYGRCFSCQARVWYSEKRVPELIAAPAFAPAQLSSVQNNTTKPLLWQAQEWEALLALHPILCNRLLHGPSYDVRRARQYLAFRGIPLDLAEAQQVSYLPVYPVLPRALPVQKVLHRWHERIIFPLTHPTDQIGFLGRSLWGWYAHMSEIDHLCVLTHPKAPRRWLKTHVAGWFGPPADRLAETVVMVEGSFDRLALLAAGLPPETVIASVGLSLSIYALAPRVRRLILAFDGDQAERQAMHILAAEAQRSGIEVSICAPPPDSLGTDWSTRWQQHRRDGVHPVLSAFGS